MRARYFIMVGAMTAGAAAFSLPKAAPARIPGCSWTAYPYSLNPTHVPANSSDNNVTFFVENTGSVNLSVTVNPPTPLMNVTITGYTPESGTIMPGTGSREDFDVIFSTGAGGASGHVVFNFTTNCGSGNSKANFFIDP